MPSTNPPRFALRYETFGTISSYMFETEDQAKAFIQAEAISTFDLYICHLHLQERNNAQITIASESESGGAALAAKAVTKAQAPEPPAE